MTRWTLLGAALLSVTATVASAQTTATPPVTATSDVPAPTANARGGRGQRAAQPGAANPVAAMNQVQNMLDGYVLKQAQNALQLSDAQWVAFLPKMDALQKLRRLHQKEHNQLINQLNQAAPAPKAGVQATSADDATLAARVKAVDDLELQMATDERAAVAAVDSILTVYQRARFRVFEENMEREKLGMLAKVMANPNAGGPPAQTPAPPKGGGVR